MGSRYLTDLADVVRGAGLAVVEDPAGRAGARVGYYSGGLPCAVMIHHTASGPSSDGQPDCDYMCYRADARPIANLLLSRTGQVWVMAAGATNTNGSGGPLGPVPSDSMNSSAIGIEAGNDGVGEPWPQTQQEAYTTLVRALCDRYAIDVGNVHSHAEWAPGRKVDPAGPSRWTASGTWNEDAFRGDVATGWPGQLPPPTAPLPEVTNVLILFTIWDAANPDRTYVSNRMTTGGSTPKPSTLYAYMGLAGLPTDLQTCNRVQPAGPASTSTPAVTGSPTPTYKEKRCPRRKRPTTTTRSRWTPRP
jgi:hypothetical protein